MPHQDDQLLEALASRVKPMASHTPTIPTKGVSIGPMTGRERPYADLHIGRTRPFPDMFLGAAQGLRRFFEPNPNSPIPGMEAVTVGPNAIPLSQGRQYLTKALNSVGDDLIDHAGRKGVQQSSPGASQALLGIESITEGAKKSGLPDDELDDELLSYLSQVFTGRKFDPFLK